MSGIIRGTNVVFELAHTPVLEVFEVGREAVLSKNAELKTEKE